ncbi:MAG: FtsW/RodA/SpoVE family cell cycle protein, partial [Weeksellaceae bacterium]
SSFIEQFGFMSGVLLIALYAIGFWFLFQKIINLSREKDDAGRFHYFYVLGFTTILIVQTCINIGMNVGMLPIAGITLPFISYGGSSLLTLFFGLGLAIW